MRYGLIGEKLGHSFSKIIHEQLADYTYDLIPIAKMDFDDFMTKKNFTALNVTIPYKESVLPYLYELDTAAKKIGAVNTIVNRNGKLFGYNTDYFGFRYMLEHHRIAVSGKKVLLLGKGGASKAVFAVLQDCGAKEILTVYYKPSTDTISYETCYAQHTDAQIIINTTPVGMYPQIADTPIDLSVFTQLEAVIDVIYNPLHTRFLLDAKQRGILAVGGMEMLIAQAKYAVEIFLNKKMDDAMIDKIYRNLWKERSNIVLIGMSGCGKSTIGQAVAKQLGKTLIDTDAEIIKKIGMPIADYFAKYGESEFRRIEHAVVQEIAAQNSAVISTGGGVILNPENITALQQNGYTIWLRRNADLLESGNGRPLVPTAAATMALYQKRLPLYTASAQAVVENNGSILQCTQEVLSAYRILLSQI